MTRIRERRRAVKVLNAGAERNRIIRADRIDRDIFFNVDRQLVDCIDEIDKPDEVNNRVILNIDAEEKFDRSNRQLGTAARKIFRLSQEISISAAAPRLRNGR